MATTGNSSSANILVVDDEPDLRTLYELTLLREGYRVETAGTVAEAIERQQSGRYDVVITDMRLPDGQGLELLRNSLRNSTQNAQTGQPAGHERYVVITAYGSAENAVEALKSGAFDYLTKPVDLKQFRAVVASALQDSVASSASATSAVGASGGSGGPAGSSKDIPSSASAAPASTASSSASESIAHPALQKLVGDSEAMRLVKNRIVKVARSMAPVLVRGESGTGKELVARAIHDCSHRSDGPFIAVNCGAIPENLLEAEFFGAKKGSYTGATQDRDGYFQAARGGTLFLDEIGDLPVAMQSKLLRAIQERHVRPIGSTAEDIVDVRIVSATHRDLAADVQSGRFRQDLFYRLNVIDIAVPPLRDRRGDLPALCAALLSRIASESGMPAPTLSSGVLAELASQPLPGNVRELENLLHRAVALSDGDELFVDAVVSRNGSQSAKADGAPSNSAFGALQNSAAADGGAPADLQAYLDAQEREILVRTLHETGFNRTAAAAKLGLSLRQIRYRIARLNISTPFGEDAGEDAA